MVERLVYLMFLAFILMNIIPFFHFLQLILEILSNKGPRGITERNTQEPHSLPRIPHLESMENAGHASAFYISYKRRRRASPPLRIPVAIKGKSDGDMLPPS
jgi:hypothetical protein